MLGLILSLSLGFCTLFLLTSDFFLGSLFEFLGVATLVLGWFIAAPAYYFLTRTTDTDTETAIETERTSSAETSSTDPMETLRQRYAAGELSEAEFERKLERLLETEDRPADDSVSAATSVDDREPSRLDRDLEYE